MIPRADIVGIDIEDDLEEIVDQIHLATHLNARVKATSAILLASYG